VGAVLGSAAALTYLSAVTSVDYASGDQPHRQPAAAEDDLIDNWTWRLPPAATASTEFSINGLGVRLPYRMGGRFQVTGCGSARVEATLTAAGIAATAPLRAGRESDPPPVFAEKLSKAIAMMVLTFRRLDTAPCVAKVAWNSAALTHTGFFGIRPPHGLNPF
jgi:hypothetical protein